MQKIKKIATQFPMLNKTVFFIVLLTLFFAVLSAANAIDINVDNSTVGGGIQKGLNLANDTDTILLAPGNYNGNNNTGININKNITLKGNGPTNSVVIDAQGQSRIFTMGSNINVKFVNIMFINGKTTGNGGAILNNAGNTMMTFMDCSFINNTATLTNSKDGKGGAIYNAGAEFSVSNSNFINNKAESGNGYNTYGGAIYNTGHNFTINNNSSFTNNTAYEGGAIYNDYGTNFTVGNSSFKDNHAGKIAGAIMNYGGNFTVTNSCFINNSVTGDEFGYGGTGGAIHNTGTNFIVANSHFADNLAKGSTSDGYGGAIYNSNNNFKVENSTFANNIADVGAGIYLSNSANNCTVTNSTFVANIAKSGAAIRNNIGVNFTVANSIFLNNIANTYGGAIYNTGVKFTVANSTFTDNTAKSNGGAIYNTGTNSTVVNSTFTGNTGTYGGAVYNTGTNSTVINSTFAGNTAKSNGAGIYNQGSMLVSGNTMENNNAALGNMIYNAGNMGVLNLTYLNNDTIKVVNGQNITLFATLTDDMGNTITGKNISFIVNGIVVGSITSVEGNASINYTVPDFEGLLPVSGDYAGHFNYQISLLNGQLRGLIETNSTINTPDNIKVGQKINVTGTATDKNGNPIANTIINVIIGGKNYTVTTDDNGDWILPYTTTQAGNINASVQWNGNDSFLGFINNTSFNVEKSSTNSTILVPDNVNVGETINITGLAKDEFDNPLAITVLNVIVNNQPFTVTTDATGIWNLDYIPSVSGNFNISVDWEGNEKYFGFVNITSFNAVEAISDDTNITNFTNNHTSNDTIDDIDDDTPLYASNCTINFIKRDTPTNTTNNSTNNLNKASLSIETKANMKKTGIPFILAIVVSLTCVGLLAYRRIYQE